jgi:hypothetical protein
VLIGFFKVTGLLRYARNDEIYIPCEGLLPAIRAITDIRRCEPQVKQSSGLCDL